MNIALRTPQPMRHPAPTARACALAHLVFERPDLTRAEDFLTDFGLLLAERGRDVVYLRGAAPTPYCYRVHRGSAPRFVGMGFRVSAREELERLARVAGASAIAPCSHLGGGECVTLRDPSGFRVEVIYGQQPAPALASRPPIPLNVGPTPTRINATQRPPVEPPEVIKLGHVVVEVAEYQATCAWYTQHLGFVPSDVQVLPDGSPAVSFLRLDLGETPTDHHTLAIVQGVMPQYGHSAYEVVDADAVGMGQRVLREKGWKHAWGIGRHILGSQIFDYWQDPWGDKHEHYCDGDLFTADQPLGIHPVSREAMAQWGQPMPSSFTKPRLTPATLPAVLRNVRQSPDLSLTKLITLARLFG